MSDASEPLVEEAFLGDVTTPAETIPGYGEVQFEESSEAPPPEAPFEDATVSIGDGVCVVCGAPTFRPPGLTKAGRRRRVPRYCDLHSPNARLSSDGPLSARLESQLQRVQEELADDFRLLGTLAGPLLPTTGYYMFTEADQFTVAILKLAKNNTRALRVLHRMASVAPVYEVAKTCAGVAYSIQVDTNRADPHNTIAHRLGVTRAYNAVHPTEEPNAEHSNGQFSPPPRYAASH